MNNNTVPDNRCGFEFEWDTSIPLTPDNIISNDSGIIGVRLGEFDINNQTCFRECPDENRHCEWHDSGSSKITSEVIEKEKKGAGGVVPNPRFDRVVGADLSGLALPYLDVENKIVDTTFNRSVLLFANLSDINILGTDFSGSHLGESLLIDSTVDRGRDWGKATSFADAVLTGANLSKTAFNQPNFQRAKFDSATTFSEGQLIPGGNFKNAELNGVDLTSIIAQDCSFSGSGLKDAVFHGSKLANSSFENANCVGVDFQNAVLENTEMTGTDLRSADFENAELSSVNFTEATIDHGTNFGEKSIYELQKDTDDSFSTESHRNLKAIWTYRLLTNLHQNNGLLRRASHYYLQEKDLRRRQHRREIVTEGKTHALNRYEGGCELFHKLKICLNYSKSELSRFAIKYGESPYRPVYLSIALVTVLSFVYPFWGLRTTDGTIRYSFLSEAESNADLGTQWELWTKLVDFSFSTLIRTTPQDMEAIGFGGFIAGVESVIGASIVALLVFVLTRRATS